MFPGDDNYYIGVALSTMCVFFGLLLGLIALAAYENVSELNTVVEGEASAALAIMDDSELLPVSVQDALKLQLREYCRAVIKDEWPLQRKGIVPTGTRERISGIRDTLAMFVPENDSQRIGQTMCLDDFKQFEANSVELHGGKYFDLFAPRHLSRSGVQIADGGASHLSSDLHRDRRSHVAVISRSVPRLGTVGRILDFGKRHVLGCAGRVGCIVLPRKVPHRALVRSGAYVLANARERPRQGGLGDPRACRRGRSR